jgi:eukaryotic-like serine/threonine-protein kinase
MTIGPGKRFGPYEVVDKIGVGGMGEVYRATDTSLKRDVAVKVLPESVASDPDRLARFQREAEVLASLNHPNIAQIYGLEKADSDTVIVMELIEGPTLADRIAEGPIPADEALGIARQIADALEAAHGRQVVHRDLKPENVKLKPDGIIKVLDFGIAKTMGVEAMSGNRSPVMTTPAVTETGVILGTAAYMSPEQARGKPVDQRTDIWAFGCLLFEMLTGQPAFGGEDVMLTLARVLDRDTDMSSMPGTISPAVRHTIKLCLEKDPRKRISDIRDVRLALAGAFDTELPAGTPATTAAARPRPTVLALGVVAVAALTGAAAWFAKPTPHSAPGIVTRFDYALPDNVSLRNPVTSVLDIAPDGDFFAFNGTDGLRVRAMGDPETRLIPGTGGTVADVVVSPGGRELAYYRNENGSVQIAKISASGGAPVVLADGLKNPYGLSWEADGTILYGQPDGIWRVSENGGTPAQVIKTESPEQGYGPQLLPGGEWVLFTLARTAGPNRWNEADIVVESLKTAERRVLRSGGFDARYVPTGHLTYVFDNVLFASTFDAATLTLGDERVSLVQGVQAAGVPGGLGGSAFYAFSNNGTLVYVPGAVGATTARPERKLVWVDRQGNMEPLPVRPDDYSMARISPDGKRIALVVGSVLPRSDPAPDIYIFDLETENLSQLTFDPQSDDGPVWSRDGSRIFFRSYRQDNVGAVYSIPADGGDAKFLARSPTGQNPLPWSISPDGKTLLLVDALSLTDADIATLKIDQDDMLAPLVDDAELTTEPSLSPDGQWLLYSHRASAANGPEASETNIRPFPGVTQQRRPVGPGAHPVFSADGSEIFFFDGDGISAAAVQYAPFRVGNVQKLFRGQYWYGVAGPNGALGRAWDVDPKNNRFLMITMPGTSGNSADARPQIEVVLNWFDELKTRVPVR